MVQILTITCSSSSAAIMMMSSCALAAYQDTAFDYCTTN